MRFKFLIIVLLISKILNAQTHISYSEPFPEPDAWIKQLVSLNDGRTAFITFSKDVGVRTIVYDKSHKLIVNGITENEFWTNRKVTAAIIKGAFEVNGQIILFLTQLNSGNMLSFHRLIISAETGKIIKADKLEEIPTNRAWGFNLTHSSSFVVSNDFYIVLDKMTGNYAVLTFEGYTAAKENRLKLTLYSNDHSVLKEAFLDSRLNETKFVHYGGMAIWRNSVFVCTNDYDSRAKKRQTNVYLSVLRNDKKVFETAKLDIKPFNGISYNDIYYNPSNNMLQMMTHTETDRDVKWEIDMNTINTYYTSTFTIIDPGSLNIISSKPYKADKADQLAKKELGIPGGLNSVLPQMFINQKGQTVLTASSYSSKQFQNSGGTFKENMAITYLDSFGSEMTAYALNIPQLRTSLIKEYPEGSVGLPFLSTQAGDFIIFNQNQNTVIYKLKNGIANKSFLFGTTEGKFSYKMISGPVVFNEHLNTLAVLMIDKKDKEMNAHIAWVEF